MEGEREEGREGGRGRKEGVGEKGRERGRNGGKGEGGREREGEGRKGGRVEVSIHHNICTSVGCISISTLQ